jgi:hypothetical protein
MADFDNTQALQEGWDLFDVDGRLQLQRIDCPGDHRHVGVDYDYPKWHSDADAIVFVARRAYDGSDYHYDAISRIGTLSE